MNTSSSLAHLATAHLLYQDDNGLSLLGSRCARCNELYFPATGSCTACCCTQMHTCDIGNHGHLWSWTVQAFQPKAPYNAHEADGQFQPYGVGYVEMPNGVKVESRLTCADATQLRIGMPMRLCVVQYGRNADGTALQTFAFTPTDSGDY
ncbi:hypothetical protein D9M71_147970 [compost metagenome]